MSWREDAACRGEGPDAWFGQLLGRPKRRGRNLPVEAAAEEQAVATCRRCSVREACLGFAVEHRIAYGVWGGLTWLERRDLVPPGRRERAQVVEGPRRVAAPRVEVDPRRVGAAEWMDGNEWNIEA